MLEKHFNIGNLVIFVDNSYVTDEKGKGCQLPSFRESIYQVIDGNKPFPTDNSHSHSCTPINNIKVRDIYDGTIFHCSNINLLRLNHSFQFGKDVPVVKYKGEIKKVSDVFVIYPQFLNL
jgi:hypothetical protein